ncbi:predicted protein [Naegleria gruberi]|uniref:Predicted protein n=1 Tax=Naegleria gruberi TaxID=5762 RepID=D2VPQ1_NAEGR|nr:uncharacterized protein NAEGRDRAFT_70943 [Naegleria gruberi]EFC41168.1 predicted protein [Naegleria gruberi]|eukprot:XP_002673912.1 predicted protein [Naegleria gruberi strain NEG-M]
MCRFDKWHLVILLLLVLVFSVHCFQPSYNLSKVAGGGSIIGDGLVSSQVLLSSPSGIIVSNSEIIFCDTNNHRIRKIDTNGVVSTIAGTGNAGYSGDGANALFAQLNSPQGIGLLSGGAIIVSDTLNHRIRKIENGIISTIAGTGSPGYTASGTATSALINTPLGLAVYNNEVYFADSLNHVIRKISSSGSISNEQGVGATSGSQTLPLQMNTPTGVVFQSGTMYMADSKNLRVCYPGFLGIINCISTSSEPIGLGVYSGVVYAALLGNVIVSLQSGTPIVAGTGTSGFSGDGGVATSALLNGPSALTFDSSGNMLISDSSNNRIRKVTNGIISTLAGTSNRNFGNGAVGTLVSLSSPNSVYYAGNDDSTGGILIADMNNHVLRRLKDGRIYNVIGNVGISGSNSGNGVTVNAATLNSPPFVMKRFGDLIYFLDSGGCALRRIESSGVLKLVVGSCNSGNQDYFLSKSFDISSDGIIYIADYYNHRIAKFVIGGTSLTTLAGGSLKGFADGVGSNANLNYPDSISIGLNNMLYFSDRDNHAIRSVSTINALVTTISGSGIAGYTGDEGPAIYAKLNLPGSIEVALNGDIIFMDKGNQRIRKITKYGNIFTLYGNGSTSVFNNANGLTLGGSGEIYIADSGNNLIKMLSSAKCTNGTFYNSSSFECQCPSGYYGETCLEYDCAGVNSNSSLVCSGRGTCFKPNTCNCSAPYFGGYCEQYYCNGVNVLNSSVCSSNGQCTAPDNCTCSFGTFGLNCENAYCQGIVSWNETVCNSRGKCIGYNKCTCNDGFYGNNCEFYNCYGIKNTDSSVCSGNGICSKIDNCTCLDGYYGNNCSDFNCVGELFTSGKNLCQNNGSCTGPGDCTCLPEWGGSICQYFKCFNKTHVDPKVCSAHGQFCSSHGQCLNPDQCTCNNGYSGSECEYRVCYGLNHTDANVCSSHGQCTAPNTCKCENGFVGDNCEYHQVYLDIANALIYSNYDSLLNISRNASVNDQQVLNSECSDLLESSELAKLGESDLISCYWTNNYFKIKLGYNHMIQHLSTLKLNYFNISLQVNSNSSLTLLNQRTFASSMDVLLLSIPSTQDFIIKSNSDDYYHTFKKISKSWTCENCPQSLVNYLTNYENKSMILIPSTLLNSIPLDSSYSKILSLKYSSMNSIQKLLTSSDKTRIESSKNLPPYFTWHGENVKDAQFKCVGHNCIVESSLNSMNSSISFTFSGFFSLLNSQFSQKQMFRLVNVYNNELVDSEYSSNAQIVGFQLKTYVSTSLSYYFSYTTFDRLDHVLTNVNRTLSLSDDSTFAISIFNPDPFISTFTLSDYFTYNYEFYQVNSISNSNLKLITSSNQKSLNIDATQLNLSEGTYLVNLTLTVSKSYVTIPYYFFGYIQLHSQSNVPKLTIDQLPAIYASNKDLQLKVLIQSSSSILNYKWKLKDGIVKERELIEQLLQNSQLTQLTSNVYKSEITINSQYLLEGEFISFDFSVSNMNGISNVSLSTRIDESPRFSCEYFNLKNEFTNYAFESLLSISCFNLPEEPISSFNIEFHSQKNGKRMNVISNTLKKNVITRIPFYSFDEQQVNLVVKLVNRYGSVSQISRNISVLPPLTIYNSGNSIASRFNYLKQSYYNLKLNEPLRIDTAHSIYSLMSILIQNETISNITRQLVNEISSNELSTFNSLLKDMIIQLKSIQSLSYKVDEKFIQLSLPIISQIYSILDNLSLDDSWVSDISTWLDWIYSGMSSAKQYYSETLLATILSNEHYEELKLIQNILSNRYSNRLDKQELISKYRAQYLMLTGLSDDSSYQVYPVEVASQLNGKSIMTTINQEIQIQATLPSDLTSQLSSISDNSQLFFSSSLISNDKTLNNILSNIPVLDLSIYSSDGSLTSVNNLLNPIQVKFNNLFTDYKVNTNLSCVYFDSSLNTWSTNGISFKSTITKQENGKLYFDMECNTTHLSLFSVQELDFVYPANSTSTDSNLGLILGLALGISIPVILLIILAFIIIVIVLSVFVWRLKKKSKAQMAKFDIEMTGTDFPSDASMFLTPLVSVSGSSSNNESFNPLSRYLDLVRIGQGAFGSVFRAMDSKTNTMKAIKVMRYQSNEELNGFMKEGTQLMNVSHPNILKVNDFFISQDNLLCIDMDFYEKGDLVQLTYDSFICSEKILLQIIYQMLNALNFIHTSMKLIHRDIKPSNIFIKSIDNDHIEIVIADFGLARADQGSAHKSYAGTPLFMSPELGYGGKYYFNTDIYSLGVTLYQIMTKDTQTSISQLLITKDKIEVNAILKQKFEECKIYSSNLIDLVISMLEKDLTIRPQAKTLLNNPLFKSFQ